MEPEQGEGRHPFLAGRLAESPDLLAEVETAEKLGISLKRLRGWEPVTAYAYNRGRLVSSQPEPEWDEGEQGWMLALRLYRLNRCPGCGGDLTVTASPEHEDRYRPDPPVQCFRCVAFGQSHKAHADQPHPQSLIHLVPQRPG